MTITDQQSDDRATSPDEHESPGDEAVQIPSLARLTWQIVLALREIGGAVSMHQIGEWVADSLALTEQQRTAMVPSGSATRFITQLRWAGYELTKVGVVNYPRRGYRELTELGMGADEKRIKEMITEVGPNWSDDTEVEREPEDAEEESAIEATRTLVEKFLTETEYPTEAHEEQKRLREEWAEKLAPENIASFSRLDLTAIASHGTWSSGMYVYPSVRGVMQWIRQMDDTDYARTIESIRYLGELHRIGS